jgi:hypothetical protein
MSQARLSVLSSSLSTVMVRAAAAVTMGLALILGSMGAGPSASAEGSASVFYGYVLADAPHALPERVGALGAGGALCGSAVVVPVSEFVGFYALSVTSGDAKPGCPPAKGGVVQFAMLSGRLDEGIRAEQVGILSGSPQILNLRPATTLIPSWSGTPGNVDGGSLLRWIDIDAPLEAALSTLPFAAGDVYYLDPASGMFAHVTSLDLVLRAGDLLFVQFR